MHHLRRRALLALSVVAALSSWTVAAAQGIDVDQFKNQVLVLLNEQRALDGLPPLQRVGALEAAAQSYSETMMRATGGGAVYVAHVGPDGSTLASRVSATGYAWYSLGEDLAAGQTTPQQVVAQWMSSPQHRDNILNPKFGDAGIGIAIGPGIWPDGHQDAQIIWWAVDFGESAAAPGQPGSFQPAPRPLITGYTSLDGTATTAAPFGSLLVINGQNLGLTGTVTFHGQPTSALSWTPTAILTLVPLQPSYPDTGPVGLSMAGQTAIGPDFTTEQPNALPSLPWSSPSPWPGYPPAAGSGPAPGSLPAAASPVIQQLLDTNQQPFMAVQQGELINIQGSGFGSGSQGRVLFVTPSGDTRDGAVWDWSDGSIAAFAPSMSGSMQVVVQVNVNGAAVASNRVPLTVQ